MPNTSKVKHKGLRQKLLKKILSYETISLNEAFKRRKIWIRVKWRRNGRRRRRRILREESTFGINVVHARFSSLSLYVFMYVRVCWFSSPFPRTRGSSVRSLNSRASLFLFSSFPDPLPSRHLVFPLFSPALGVHSASLRVESARVSSRASSIAFQAPVCARLKQGHTELQKNLCGWLCTFTIAL